MKLLDGGSRMLLWLLVFVLIALVICLWNESSAYKIGDKVTIKDCTVWLTSDEQMEVGGVGTLGLPKHTSRGYVIGEYSGVVKSIGVARRQALLRPVYYYNVEFHYKHYVRTERYLGKGLGEYTPPIDNEVPTTQGHRFRIPIGN